MMKSSIKNMVLVLGTITLISSLAVSGFYLLTKDAIEFANQSKINNAIAEVMPGFDNAPSNEMFLCQVPGTTDSLSVYPARKGEKLIGYAVKTFSNKGYGGNVELMVGILSNGNIASVSVVAESETPGLGHKMSTDSILVSQFKGINPEKKKISVKKDNGDIDAITAATISSRAFCEAVNRALAVVNPLIKKTTDASSGATHVKKEE